MHAPYPLRAERTRACPPRTAAAVQATRRRRSHGVVMAQASSEHPRQSARMRVRMHLRMRVRTCFCVPMLMVLRELPTVTVPRWVPTLTVPRGAGLAGAAFLAGGGALRGTATARGGQRWWGWAGWGARPALGWAQQAVRLGVGGGRFRGGGGCGPQGAAQGGHGGILGMKGAEVAPGRDGAPAVALPRAGPHTHPTPMLT